mmetsp:Transcript_16369/g.24661  ORF Transcript_16369/g.24661 Transcript_16369/m.24661 type:complete len:152 (-) Transcript_16369:141-596(-)
MAQWESLEVDFKQRVDKTFESLEEKGVKLLGSVNKSAKAKELVKKILREHLKKARSYAMREFKSIRKIYDKEGKKKTEKNPDEIVEKVRISQRKALAEKLQEKLTTLQSETKELAKSVSDLKDQRAELTGKLGEISKAYLTAFAACEKATA